MVGLKSLKAIKFNLIADFTVEMNNYDNRGFSNFSKLWNTIVLVVKTDGCKITFTLFQTYFF